MRRRDTHDYKAVAALSASVTDWARYQDLAGDWDCVETSPVTGTYDWRSYLQEETQLARRREESKSRDKKADRQPPAPAPAGFYA